MRKCINVSGNYFHLLFVALGIYFSTHFLSSDGGVRSVGGGESIFKLNQLFCCGNDDETRSRICCPANYQHRIGVALMISCENCNFNAVANIYNWLE